MSKRTIYISIPMTGYDMDIQRQIAALWQKFWESQGYTVVNPFEVAEVLKKVYKTQYNREPTEREYLTEDLVHVMACTDMFLCNGWATSRGCLEEVYLAQSQNIKFYYESKFKVG